MNQIPQDKDRPISRRHLSHNSADHNSILLVSLDYPTPRASLVEVLVSAGYMVCGRSGRNAQLDVLEARDFDALVLDTDFITAPLETVCFGFGHDLPSVRIIILGPRVGPAVKAHLLEIGADDYIEKPFDTRELIARIDSAFRRGASDWARRRSSQGALNIAKRIQA